MTGHQGLTLAPEGPYVIPHARGHDMFDAAKCIFLLKLESCRPALPKEGRGLAPLPSKVVIQIREALVPPALLHWPLKTAESYHQDINGREFEFQLHMSRMAVIPRMAVREALTEVAFDLPDPFRRAVKPVEPVEPVERVEPDEESVVLANLRATEAEW
jgi:hypothetical protein